MLVSPIGFGSFKIGRNQGIKYPDAYDLPDEGEVRRLLEGVLDLGINLIDTAPAYGLSEQRIGRALSHRRRDYILSTKVGETFIDGRSTFDFSQRAVRQSVNRSLRLLKTDVVDLLLIHSDGNERALLQDTDLVETLRDFRDRGLVRAIGLSAKTIQGARAALGWADVIMVEYHLRDRSHAGIIAEAARADVGVLIKKGLASGRLDPTEAIRFVLETPGVSSLLVGGLSIDHLRRNIRLAETIDEKIAESR